MKTPFLDDTFCELQIVKLGHAEDLTENIQYTAYVFRCYLSVSLSASVSPVLLSFKDRFLQFCSLPAVTYRVPSC